MSGDIIVELIDTLGSFTETMELTLLNFTPGFNYFIGSLFFVSIISLMFWVIMKSSNFIVIGTK